MPQRRRAGTENIVLIYNELVRYAIPGLLIIDWNPSYSCLYLATGSFYGVLIYNIDFEHYGNH